MVISILTWKEYMDLFFLRLFIRSLTRHYHFIPYLWLLKKSAFIGHSIIGKIFRMTKSFASSIRFFYILLQCLSGWATATAQDTYTIAYTGQSLGALGVLRSQEEHDLIIEQANSKKIDFKLISHACWRAKGYTAILPSHEPIGFELQEILEKKDQAKSIQNWKGYRTPHVMLVQDPTHAKIDQIELFMNHPRRQAIYPEIKEIDIKIYYIELHDTTKAILFEEKGAEWPSDPGMWAMGEMNRVDLAPHSRLFELPDNLGEMAVRATRLKQLRAAHASHSFRAIDLGHRTGHFDIDLMSQARADFEILKSLGYTISVPYHLELTIGVDSIKKIKSVFPALRLLAANITCKDSTVFQPYLIDTMGDQLIGLIGLVDPEVQGSLSKKVLTDYKFVPVLDAVKKQIVQLKNKQVQTILILSNMDPIENGFLENQIQGIDVIIGNFNLPYSAAAIQQKVIMTGPRHEYRTAAMMTKSIPDGKGISVLEIEYKKDQLAQITHASYPITDQIPKDTATHRAIQAIRRNMIFARGPLMFPAFIDILDKNPKLKSFDAITQKGRVSQDLWENMVGRFLRQAGPAELTIFKKLPYFPPLIGKLHEHEIRSWLWNEDNLILCDIKGRSILKLLADDLHQELVFSGLTKPTIQANAQQGLGTMAALMNQDWLQRNVRIMGRAIEPEAYYRVVTTDVLFEGSRAAYFVEAKRIRREFIMDSEGNLKSDAAAGKPISLRDFMLSELRKIRFSHKSEKKYIETIAGHLMPDPLYEKLLIFNFDRPTLWTSYNRKYNTAGYGSVPESRIIANNSWVVGASGQFRVTVDAPKFAFDLGTTLAYARQKAEISPTLQQVTESDDDIKLDLTYRMKSKGVIQPFARTQYDTEFTPTINPTTKLTNKKQNALRGLIGITRRASRYWRNMELASILEQDFAQNKAQLGITGRAIGRYPIRKTGVFYSIRNDATFFFNSSKDTPRDLALRYNMVHEILVPIMDELSLTMGADLFFFKGKIIENKEPGMSVLMRVGITYDRLWKPRYQPLF
jgi:hypothetical protein